MTEFGANILSESELCGNPPAAELEGADSEVALLLRELHLEHLIPEFNGK